MVHDSHSVADTEALAAQLAQTLRGGECIALSGPLGAGKTQFVRGLVRGLGGDERAVSSPTFVLLNIYEGGRLTVYHLDAYRVTQTDLEEIGFAELLDQQGVVVLEWPQRAAGLLPPGRINVTMEPVGPTNRRIEVRHST